MIGQRRKLWPATRPLPTPPWEKPLTHLGDKTPIISSTAHTAWQLRVGAGKARCLLFHGPASGSRDRKEFLEPVQQQRALGRDRLAAATQWQPEALHVPERPPTSIFFRFLASKMQTVSFPAVGT